MTRPVGLVTASLVVLLAGCGSYDAEELVGASPDPGYSYSSGPVPDDEPGDRAPFGFDVAIRQVADDTLVVRYGDSSSCPHEKVDAEVRESATEVVVTLTAVAPGPQPCTDDYGARDVTLQLDAPLAERRVVDGSTGDEVAVATGEPPGPPGSPVPLISD